MHNHFSEKIRFPYQNHYFLLISRASWRKNLVTQVKLGEKKNGYLAEKMVTWRKNMVTWRKKTVTRRKKMVTGWKNHVTFLHFT